MILAQKYKNRFFFSRGYFIPLVARTKKYVLLGLRLQHTQNLSKSECQHGV